MSDPIASANLKDEGPGANKPRIIRVEIILFVEGDRETQLGLAQAVGRGIRRAMASAGGTDQEDGDEWAAHGREAYFRPCRCWAAFSSNTSTGYPSKASNRP